MIASAYRWERDGAVGWLVQAPGVEPSTGEAETRGAANDQIMAKAREAGCPAVIITARHPNEGRPCHA